MAVINPTPADFIANQERALDYQQYRSSSDILRAVAEYYKVSIFKDNEPDKLNYITNGLHTSVVILNDKIQIIVESGSGVFDNQPVIFLNDFIFEYDKPDSDTTYYVYLYYKYVEEYPPNYAFISIYTSEVTDTNYRLLARVEYRANDDAAIVDNSPRDALTSDALNSVNNGCTLLPVQISSSGIVTLNVLYMVDTSGGSLDITISDNLQPNDTIVFFDMKNSFDQHPLTIYPPDGYTINFKDQFVANNKGQIIRLQLMDPAQDKNFYLIHDDAHVIDGGEY